MQQPGGANGRGGGVLQDPVFQRRVEVPRRNAVGRAMGDVEIRASLRGFDEMRIAAVVVTGGETVESPCQSARPAGIAAIALMGGMPEKLACIGIEEAFLGGGSIAAHQHPARGVSMPHGDIAQPPVSGFPRREENQRDIHHDVDGQRIVGDEGSQVLALAPDSAAPGSCPRPPAPPAESGS